MDLINTIFVCLAITLAGVEAAASKAEWYLGPWMPCTHSCGDFGYQFREVTCEVLANYPGTNYWHDAIVSDEECQHMHRPEDAKSCNRVPCPGAWHLEKWTS